MAATPAQQCRDRTAVENVWPTVQQAQGFARLLRRVSVGMVDAEAYQCPVCAKWHVRRVEKGPGLRVVR